jgi:hypothetical protein
MKYLENDTAWFYYSDLMHAAITKFCMVLKEHPFIIEPERYVNEKAKDILDRDGFEVYPTVEATTLFYDRQTDCFFKFVHPLTLKRKIVFLLSDKASCIYNLSEYLIKNGIRVPKVEAFGKIKKPGLPCFVTRRIEGKSLYDVLIRRQQEVDMKTYLSIVDEIARLHTLCLWLGDAHLSHVFVDGSGFSGFIDIDSIRKNRPFSIKRLAKDIAGFNHPALPLSDEEKKMLLHHYMKKAGIKNMKRFTKLVKRYTERRWKG